MGFAKLRENATILPFTENTTFVRKQLITIHKDMQWRHGLDLVLSVNRSDLIVWNRKGLTSHARKSLECNRIVLEGLEDRVKAVLALKQKA